MKHISRNILYTLRLVSLQENILNEGKKVDLRRGLCFHDALLSDLNHYESCHEI